MPVFLDTTDPDFETEFARLLGAKREADADVDATVAAIIADVAARGDAALLDYTERFDRLKLTQAGLAITAAEVDAAIARVPEAERAALQLAADRIAAYHERQKPEDRRWTDASGAELGWRWSAVEAAGLYVPGGLASYPSSLL
ncbi:MAG: histidinol dehydrogenase, partial [Rubricella sp.]